MWFWEKAVGASIYMIVLYHLREGWRSASANEQTPQHFECSRKVANSDPARTLGRFGCIHFAKSPEKVVFTGRDGSNIHRKLEFCPVQRGSFGSQTVRRTGEQRFEAFVLDEGFYSVWTCSSSSSSKHSFAQLSKASRDQTRKVFCSFFVSDDFKLQ